MGSEAMEERAPIAGRPAEVATPGIGALDGVAVAQAERRHGPLAEVREIVVAETLARLDALALADRSAWLHAKADGRTYAVVAWQGSYYVVRLCAPFDPDTLRLPSGGPQIMTWALADGIHPIMRTRGARTLFRTAVTIQKDR